MGVAKRPNRQSSTESNGDTEREMEREREKEREKERARERRLTEDVSLLRKSSLQGELGAGAAFYIAAASLPKLDKDKETD